MEQLELAENAGELIVAAAQLLTQARAPSHVVDLLLDALRELSDLGVFNEELSVGEELGG